MLSWLVQAPVWPTLVRRHHASPPRPRGAVGRGEAIALARAAVAKGLADATPLRYDQDFDPLRGRDEFRRLLDGLKARKK